MQKRNFLALKMESLLGFETLSVSEDRDHYTWIYDYLRTDENGQRPEIKGTVDMEFYRSAKATMVNFKIQPYLKDMRIGLDGITYTLIMGGDKIESRFSWWKALPEEWAAFIPILDDLYRNLQIARNAAKHPEVK